jgi:hypothetical protein
MTINRSDNFPKSFSIDTSPGWPDVNEPIVNVRSPEHVLGPHAGEFVNLRIYPESGSQWFAELEIGIKGDKHVETCASPDPRCCFVLAGGQVYLIDTFTHEILPVNGYPITQLKADVYRETVWLVEFSRITCVSRDGSIVWRSDVLVSDDLYVIEIRKDSFTYEGATHGEVVHRTRALSDGQPIPATYP